MTQYLQPLWSLSPKFIRDDSTSEYRWIEQRSVNEPNSGDKNLRIVIDDNASYLLLSEMLVEVDFEVSTTSNGGVLTDSHGVCIPNAWNMFDSARLMLHNKLVQDINLPGVIHHMNYSHQYSKDYADTVADQQMFYALKKVDSAGNVYTPPAFSGGTIAGLVPATYPFVSGNGDFWFPQDDPTQEFQFLVTVSSFVANTSFTATLASVGSTRPVVVRRNPEWDPAYARACKRISDCIEGGKAYCSVLLPLREIFPILGHAFNRVNRGSKIELQLNKTGTMARVFYSAQDIANLTFDIKKASIWIPRLSPELESAAQIEAQIATNQALVEPFEKFDLYQKTSQPNDGLTEQRLRMTTQTSRILRVYVALQLDDQTADITRNPVQFDSQNLEYLECRINNTKFPAETLQVANSTSGKQGIVRMLRDIHAVSGKTFDYENGSCIDFDGFFAGAQRIYVLDVSQMDNTPFKKVGVSDMEIRYKLSATTTGAYTVNVLTVSEGESKTSMLQGKMLFTQA